MIGLRKLAVAAIALGALALSMAELGYVSAWPRPHQKLPEPDRWGFAPVNGVSLWYAIYNPSAGSPVILLHGGLGSSTDWLRQLPALRDRHTVILVDSRGQGRSQRNGQPISYDLMAADVLALMDELEVPRAAIVGWSDGGIIGLDIAIHHPDRLTKLFAYGANFDVDGLIPSPIAATASSWRASLTEMFDERARTAHDIMTMWHSEPDFTPAELASIRVPTMIADGELEEAIRPEHTRELARLIPGAELVILPEVGHAGLKEDPEAFNEAMTRFLDGS